MLTGDVYDHCERRTGNQSQLNHALKNGKMMKRTCISETARLCVRFEKELDAAT